MQSATKGPVHGVVEGSREQRRGQEAAGPALAAVALTAVLMMMLGIGSNCICNCSVKCRVHAPEPVFLCQRIVAVTFDMGITRLILLTHALAHF